MLSPLLKETEDEMVNEGGTLLTSPPPLPPCLPPVPDESIRKGTSTKDLHACDAGGTTVHVDLCTYGLLHASDCTKNGRHAVVQRGNDQESESSGALVARVMASIEPSVIENFTPMVFEPGWARRPKRGDGKGASYILEHRQEIYDMFIAGELDKRQRKAPTQMLEVLQAAHPGVIALPGFSEVSSFVGSLISRAKKGQTGLPAARAAPTPAAIKNAIVPLTSNGPVKSPQVF